MNIRSLPQRLRKMQSQFTWLDQQEVFLFGNFLMLKFLFNKLSFIQVQKKYFFEFCEAIHFFEFKFKACF